MELASLPSLQVLPEPVTVLTTWASIIISMTMCTSQRLTQAQALGVHWVQAASQQWRFAGKRRLLTFPTAADRGCKHAWAFHTPPAPGGSWGCNHADFREHHLTFTLWQCSRQSRACVAKAVFSEPKFVKGSLASRFGKPLCVLQAPSLTLVEPGSGYEG